MTNHRLSAGLALVLLLAALGAACSKQSVVSEAPAQSSTASSTASTAPASSPTPAPTISSEPAMATSTATPSAVTTGATPKPTPPEYIRQAQAQPGVPVRVPESMRRPLTGDEMKKALEQLPPEVRARIQGMGAASPSPTKKP